MSQFLLLRSPSHAWTRPFLFTPKHGEQALFISLFDVYVYRLDPNVI